MLLCRKENDLANVIYSNDEAQNENSNLQKKIKKLEVLKYVTLNNKYFVVIYHLLA